MVRVSRTLLAFAAISAALLLVLSHCAGAVYSNPESVKMPVVKVFESKRFDLNPQRKIVLVYLPSVPESLREAFIRETEKAISYLNDAIEWFAEKYPRYSYLKQIRLEYKL